MNDVIAVGRIQREKEVLYEPHQEHDSSCNELLICFLRRNLGVLGTVIKLLTFLNALAPEKHGPLEHAKHQVVDHEGEHHILPVDPLRNIDDLDILDRVFNCEEQLEGQHLVQTRCLLTEGVVRLLLE